MNPAARSRWFDASRAGYASARRRMTFRRTRTAGRFGRDFTSGPPPYPPCRAIPVTGALFHTQGGLLTDRAARVVRGNEEPLPNLFAGGISGPARGGTVRERPADSGRSRIPCGGREAEHLLWRLRKWHV
ncbi:MAG: FAD-binding protein [Paracoccaceae bacterium]